MSTRDQWGSQHIVYKNVISTWFDKTRWWGNIKVANIAGRSLPTDQLPLAVSRLGNGNICGDSLDGLVRAVRCGKPGCRCAIVLFFVPRYFWLTIVWLVMRIDYNNGDVHPIIIVCCGNTDNMHCARACRLASHMAKNAGCWWQACLPPFWTAPKLKMQDGKLFLVIIDVHLQHKG